MHFLKWMELSLYRERIQESVATSRPTWFRSTSQLRQRSKVPKDQAVRVRKRSNVLQLSKDQTKLSRSCDHDPRWRGQRARQSLSVPVSTALPRSPPMKSKNLRFFTHNLICFTTYSVFSFIILPYLILFYNLVYKVTN